MGETTTKAYICERCKHEWVPNNLENKPVVCPKCKSPYWDIPRREEKKK